MSARSGGEGRQQRSHSIAGGRMTFKGLLKDGLLWQAM